MVNVFLPEHNIYNEMHVTIVSQRTMDTLGLYNNFASSWRFNSEIRCTVCMTAYNKVPI